MLREDKSWLRAKGCSRCGSTQRPGHSVYETTIPGREAVEMSDDVVPDHYTRAEFTGCGVECFGVGVAV